MKAREGAKGKDYEVKPGFPEFKDAPAAVTTDRDVAVSGTGMEPSRPGAFIREELPLQMRQLVDRGVAELEAYDKHAAESANNYKQALKRREDRRESNSSGAV